MRTARTSTGEGLRAVALCALLAGAALGVAALAAAVMSAGCIGGSDPAPSEPRIPRDVEVPEHLRDTVGELARFAGRETVGVQSYGFITGLDDTGTKVVPPGVRQQIMDMMRRKGVEGANEILARPDTAVVTVSGVLPPGIAKGEQFDLDVRALPVTETTSLEGGFLLEAELSRVTTARGVESRSEALALGRGAIFVSPFTGEAGAGKPSADPRIGRILAGGKALKTRHFRLALLVPSVRTADQIVRLVNARFPGAAKGTEDAGRVDLEVPKAYQTDKTRFLDLVGALYMREAPDARDRRIDLLIGLLKDGQDMDRVALCLESFGSAVAPRLHALADDPSEAVRFYAGRTLAWLQDAQAVHVLERPALDDKSPFQEQAVEALGRLRSGVGMGVLGRALNATSPRVRVAAWQATARLAPRTFVSQDFEEKFILSKVATKGEPFVYVSRTLRPEIALFGDIAIRPPLLSEARRVTASAQEDGKVVKLLARREGRDLILEAPLTAEGVIKVMASPVGITEDKPEATGLDLGYSDVVGLLYEMSRKGALTGPIVLQPLEYRVTGDRPIARPISTAEDGAPPAEPEP